MHHLQELQTVKMWLTFVVKRVKATRGLGLEYTKSAINCHNEDKDYLEHAN